MADNFNRGVVRGSIRSMSVRKTEKNNIPYGDIRVFCSSKEYGDLTVRVRFWGKELPSLQAAIKENAAGKYWFDGDLAILKKRGEETLCFNAYKFKPWVPAEDDEARASFIIEGIVKASFETFELHYVKKHSQYSKDFTFIFPAIDEAWGVDIDDHVTVAGHFRDIMQKYGGSGEIEPVIEKVRIKGKKATSEPF